MNDFPNSTARYIPQVLSILRIATAFMFVQHGSAKLFGFPHAAMFDGLNFISLPGIGGGLELVGGTLLLLGLLTRVTAFLLSGEMAIAYFIAHGIKGPVLSPMLNGGESAALYCFIFLFLAVAGGGAWGIDGSRLNALVKQKGF